MGHWIPTGEPSPWSCFLSGRGMSACVSSVPDTKPLITLVMFALKIYRDPK